MRIGVMSDSHGNILAATEAIKKMGQVDLILHAGDHYHDAIILKENSTIPIIAVGGNCDLAMTNPRQFYGEYEGQKLLLIHGHQYSVKKNLSGLYAHAKKRRIDIVVYGHTHVPHQEKMGDIYMLNPGSVAYPRSQGDRTFGVLNIEEARINFTIHTL